MECLRKIITIKLATMIANSSEQLLGITDIVIGIRQIIVPTKYEHTMHIGKIKHHCWL